MPSCCTRISSPSGGSCPASAGGDLVQALEKLAELLHRQGEHALAETHYREALAVREAEFGVDSLAASEGANHVARVLMAREDHGQAKALFQRSLDIMRRHLDPKHPALATSLNNLAVLYRRTGEYLDAEAAYKEAIEIYQTADDPSVHANALLNLGQLYEVVDRAPEAAVAFRRVIDLLSAASAQADVHYVEAWDRLAHVYEHAGRHAEAEGTLQELLALSRASGGDPAKVLEVELRLHRSREALGVGSGADLGASLAPLKTSVELNRQSMDMHRRGRYREAMVLAEQSLALVESVVGPQHEYVVTGLSNIGTLALELGDFRRAESAFRRAIEVAERSGSDDVPTLGTLYLNLGEFHRAKGDEPQARAAFERARALRKKTSGPSSPEYAMIVNALASLQKDAGNLAEAERLYAEAHEIFERAGSSDGLRVTSANLGFLALRRGDAIEARVQLERAIALTTADVGKDHLDVALLLDNLARVEEATGALESAEALLRQALTIIEASLGQQHYRMAPTLRHLGLLRARRGDRTNAVALLSQASAIEDTHLSHILIGGSERERQRAVATHAREANETIAFHVQAAPDEPAALRLAFATVLQRKGRVLDAMADSMGALRARSDPEVRALLERLAEVSARLAALGEPSPRAVTPGLGALTAELEQERQSLDKLASQRSAEYRPESDVISIEGVQRALPAGAALVEIFRYQPSRPRPGEHPDAGRTLRYVAYVMRVEGELDWVDLGEVPVIDRLVDTFRAALADRTRDDIAQHARALDERVMRPLRACLGEARHILLSPDGALNLVPFAALQDEHGRYLVETVSFTYLTSGRDLLRLTRRRSSRGVPLVVAGVNYALRGLDPARRQWPLLPHTLGEADAITDLFPDAVVLGPDEATEAAVRAVAGPRLLHVATHGYFEPGESEGPGAINPLLRSGLLLAGANGPPLGDDDGVLSALEVSGLDLWGTQLVVLSACETALGEVHAGEGVYGLRRALVLAGAESQVISLWQVSSKATRALMRGYYERLSAGLGRTDALHAVQRTMLAGPHPHPHEWAAFIPSGAWEPLVAAKP
jgi:CHAT domain-containing protein/tetratricopeptide (TPR) repeat protein